jgi:hypothetical protein
MRKTAIVNTESEYIKMITIQELSTLLRSTPVGRVPAETRVLVLKMLGACWTEFAGSTESKMAYWKAVREEGADDLVWDPPILSFTVERHGAMVLGSSRAEKQEWRFDLEHKTAQHCTAGFRQMRPSAPRLNVKPVAARVCEAVRQGPNANSDLVSQGIIVWKGDHVLVRHGELIPNNGYHQMTISGRRKRFRTELKSLMAALGWELVDVGRVLTFKRRREPLKLVTPAPA